ncbi:hypothetical protein UlMin_026452 [Ulmus minor]
MDPDGSPRRKVKFVPKSQNRRKSKSIPPKTEVGDEDQGVIESEALLRQFQEKNLNRRGPKAEKKAQVAFGGGDTSSSTRSIGLGVAKDDNSNRGGSSSSSTGLEGSKEDEQIILPLPSTKAEKEYVEPWDYKNSYYPIVLPLRRPYSGNPELLNKEEFGEDPTNVEYHEDSTADASELGLTEEKKEPQMMLFQLPSTLPFFKRAASTKGKEKVGSSTVSESISSSTEGGKPEDLSGGYMGKIQVYESGKVKLKLGDVLFDVSPGTDCICAEDVLAINTTKKKCCDLGELGKRAVVTPDVESLLKSETDLG